MRRLNHLFFTGADDPCIERKFIGLKEITQHKRRRMTANDERNPGRAREEISFGIDLGKFDDVDRLGLMQSLERPAQTPTVRELLRRPAVIANPRRTPQIVAIASQQ